MQMPWFLLHAFWVFGLLVVWPDSSELHLGHIYQRYRAHAQVAEWEAHAGVCCRQSFVVRRTVTERFLGIQSVYCWYYLICIGTYLIEMRLFGKMFMDISLLLTACTVVILHVLFFVLF